MPYCFLRSSVKFSGHMGPKINNLNPILSKNTRPVAAIKSLRFALFYIRNSCIFSYQLYDVSVRPSVRLSVRLSVRPSVIIKFSGVITMVKSDVHAKGQGQRSKVKVTEVNTQLSRFRTLTPVWIYIWQWNHAHSWKQHRRGALLFFKFDFFDIRNYFLKSEIIFWYQKFQFSGIRK